MTDLLNNYDLLDPTLELRKVDAAVGGGVFDRWSDLDPTLAAARINAVDPDTIDGASLLDPYRALQRLNLADFGASTYTAKAVHFEKNVGLLNTQDFSYAGPFSTVFWIKNYSPESGAGVPSFWFDNPNQTDAELTDWNSGPPGLAFQFQETGTGSDGFNAITDNVVDTSSWRCVMISNDPRHDAGTKPIFVYYGDVAQTFTFQFDGPSVNFAYHGKESGLLSFFAFCDIMGLGSFTADIADPRFMPGTLIDFSVEANRRLFIDASGKPVDPAIATAALGQPPMLFSGDKDSFASNATGSAGAFEVVKMLSANGNNGVGSVALAGATIGDNVRRVYQFADGDAHQTIADDFETTITVDGQIQQTGSSDNSAIPLVFALSNGVVTNATTSPSD